MSSSRIWGQALRAEEVEELLRSVEEDALAILDRYRVDEEAATELVLDALSSLACDRRGEGQRPIRLVETIGRAVAFRWAEEDPLEETDAIH